MRQKTNQNKITNIWLLSSITGLGGVVFFVLAAWIWLAFSDPAPWGYVTPLIGAILVVIYYRQNTEAFRRLFSRRRIFTGANAVILTLAVIGIVVLLNVIAGRHHWRADLTRTGRFSLTSQTLQVLQGLEDDVNIYAFSQAGTLEGEMIQDLLSEYDARSERLAVEVVDPDKNPALAQRYEVQAYDTVVVEAGGRTKNILPYDMFESAGYYQQGTPKFKGEQAVTQAILDLTTTEESTIYFLIGHGERDLNEDYRGIGSFIKGEAYRVEAINLAAEGKVPEDASVVVIAGPTRDLAAEEVEVIEDYLHGGGKLFIALDPMVDKNALPQLKGLLAEWGIGVHDDLVIDPARKYFVDPLSPIPRFMNHPITEELMEQNLAIVMPRSRSLYKREDVREDVELETILESSNKSWGETNFSEQSRKDPEDLEGPLALGLVATKPVETEGQPGEEESSADEAGAAREARVIVVGSSAFLTDQVLTFQGNVDFFMNAVNWLLDKGDQIYIRAKSPDFERVYLSGSEMVSVRYLTMLVMPLTFLLIGGTIWMRRRNL